MQTTSAIDPSSLEIIVTISEDNTAIVEPKIASTPGIFTPTLQLMLSRFDEQSALTVLIAIAAGMRHIHESGYAHMQLNSENILILSDNTFSITNLSHFKKIMNDSSDDAKSDVYSFAVLMNEMFSKGSKNEIISNIPSKYSNLFKACYNKKPEKRPTFTQILEELQAIGRPVVDNFGNRPNLRLTTDFTKFGGVFPAFYACYEDDGSVSIQRTKELTEHFIQAGVKGLYVGGSSGECIYLSVEERKKILEAVQEVNNHQITIIAHVACNNLRESQELARHAEQLDVDAIASIPPVYFHLPDYGIADYWNGISQAAPHTPFIIYNIPQLAGVSLTTSLLKTMLKNPNVIGVKNSSEPTQDIQMWRDAGEGKLIVFNGPDEQLVSGLLIGAGGCIGGTYGAYPELIMKAFNWVRSGENMKAREIQNDICKIIYKMGECKGNLYAILKEIIKRRNNIDCGSVRAPLSPIQEGDEAHIAEAVTMINEAYEKYELNQ